MKKSRLFLSILFYLFFISSKIYANVIVDYRFDECIWDGTTNEVKDSSGNSNHATLYNLETTKNEKVLVRSGDFTANSNSDYIDLKPTILDGEGDFTISTWIKSSASQDQTILSGANSSQQNELIMFFRNGGTTFHPYIKGSTQTINIADVTDGTWHHLVWRRDSSTGQNCITVDRNTTSCANGTTGNLNIEGLVLGQEQDSVGGGFVSNQDFEGYMDEFKIYGTRLSDSEVQDIYDNEVSGKNYDGTVREETCIEPIVDYHLDDLFNSGGSSFRVAESTDLNLTGVISPDGNSLVSKQGKVCTGAEFNGVDEYISVDDNDVFDNTQTLTTVAWIYPTELAQTNGTNARGIFSKRNSYSGNSQYAYGVFFWNGNNLSSTEASIYVDIDSQNNRTHSIKKIKVNEWTHIAIVFDGRLPQNERTKIYINGILDSVHSESSSSIPDYSSDFHIGNLYSGESEIKVFKGVMDEVKIYNKALSSTYIATLYSRENSGLDYSGTFRNCICSIMDRNATFNAVDSLGGCFNWNNKIQTKKVNTNIDLMILSRDENNTAVSDANITKVELLNYSDTACSNLIETKVIWTGNHVTNDVQSGCFNLPLFTYNRASRCSKIRIYGNLDSNDINSTATDNFAIRPDKFNFTLPTVGYAGENFNIDFDATNAQDYNETLNSSFLVESNISKNMCFNALLHVEPFSFENGVKSVDVNYSDIGDINITIKEILGNEFALVDSADTNDTDRLITPNTKNMTIKPYELNVTDVKYDEGWLYMADVDDINQSVEFSVLANNKQHILVQNFTDACYSEDVDVKTHFNVENTNSNVEIKYNDATIDDIIDINRTITIPKASFINSKADIQYSFNIQRDYKIPYEPIKIGLREVSVESSSVAKVENNATVSFDRDFYYGRVKTKDLSTNEQSTPHSLHVEVFRLGKYKQSSLNWYINEDDTNTTMTFLPKTDFSYGSNKNGVNVTNIATMSSGVINFDMTNSWSNSDSARVHLDIPLWLWYSKYNSYNSAVDCGSHPCFEYRYIKADASTGIKSGDFKGSSIGSDYNATKSKIGVKTFR